MKSRLRLNTTDESNQRIIFYRFCKIKKKKVKFPHVIWVRLMETHGAFDVNIHYNIVHVVNTGSFCIGVCVCVWECWYLWNFPLVCLFPLVMPTNIWYVYESDWCVVCTRECIFQSIIHDVAIKSLKNSLKIYDIWI